MTPVDPAAAAPEPSEAVAAPLKAFRGRRPAAPAWFQRALEDAPERGSTVVAGAAIETLVWGPRGAPGLVLLHGHGAHADWWSFIAPFFAKERRVLALSWSGMGGSDWREAYAPELFIAEVLETVAGAEMAKSPRPVVAAHSFGGGVAGLLAAAHGDRFGKVIIIDHGARPPEEEWRGPPRRRDANPVYPDLASALARFRLMPPQGCPNAFILDHIARRALKQAASGGAEPTPSGFTWRFDPAIWSKMRRPEGFQSAKRFQAAKCPLAFVWGARSSLMGPEVVGYTRAHAPPGTPFVEIPEAEHHVLLDQPLALISVLRALLAEEV